MALVLSLTSLQTNNCGSLVLTDTAGVYDSVTNLTGWGTPNLPIDTGAVTIAEFEITRPDGEVVTKSIIDNWESLTGLTNSPFGSGTSALSLSYNITSDFLGTTVDDGVYTITYTVGDGTDTYSISYTMCLYCNVECCVEQRLANVNTQYICATCDNAYSQTTVTLWALLQALKLAACQADLTKFNSILTTLQNACEQAACEC